MWTFQVFNMYDVLCSVIYPLHAWAVALCVTLSVCKTKRCRYCKNEPNDLLEQTCTAVSNLLCQCFHVQFNILCVTKFRCFKFQKHYFVFDGRNENVWESAQFVGFFLMQRCFEKCTKHQSPCFTDQSMNYSKLLNYVVWKILYCLLDCRFCLTKMLVCFMLAVFELEGEAWFRRQVSSYLVYFIIT